MILCKWHRLVIGWESDSGKTFSPRTTRHLHECPTCKEWWQGQRSLGAHLASEASKQSRRELPPQFTSALLKRIDQGETTAKDRTFAWKLLVPAAGLCAAVVVFFWPQKPAPAAAQRPLIELNLPNLAQVPAHVDDPLEKELALVISDTKKAVAFVAYNFLPTQ